MQTDRENRFCVQNHRACRRAAPKRSGFWPGHRVCGRPVRSHPSTATLEGAMSYRDVAAAFAAQAPLVPAVPSPRAEGTRRMDPIEPTVVTDHDTAGFEPRIGRSVSLDHAAELLGVSRRTIYNRIREGRLQTIRTIGGSQRVLLDSVNDIRRP
ncbi:MAG TPA: helix-turn-helix domain-containing protein [Vicinamibacterales bacterium]|nr:helix-turn-helix domain-containing protein [Vicinamibacterales bacterium]